MRTRSSAATERAREAEQKRKRKDDDPPVSDTGHRSKRCKTQFCAERAIASQSMTPRARSAFKKKLHNSTDPERAAEGLSTSRSPKNGDPEVLEMTLEKFVVGLQARGAADRGEKPCASLKKAITESPGRVISPVASTHYGEDGLQIADTVLLPGEVTGKQFQLHEDDPHSGADTNLVKGQTERYSLRKKRHASLGGCLEESKQGERNGSHTTLPKRRLKEQLLFCRRSVKCKGRLDNMKQFKNQRKGSIGSTLTEVAQQRNSSYLRKRLNAAKSRWKTLAQSILSTKISPEILAFASEDLTRSTANTKTYKATACPKRQRKPLTAANASTAVRQKVGTNQLSLLKRMKTWLNEANFQQGAKEETSNHVGEEFMMTEDKRSAFAKTMVQSCQKNPNMRKVFLESVRMLTLSGFMQAAASNLLHQGPCEEVQNVMNAWADFKENHAITKTLPLNLLTSVNQLHENRGDLSTKLSTQNVVGICTLSQIGEKTWKFQMPASPLEDSLSFKSSGQDNAI